MEAAILWQKIVAYNPKNFLKNFQPLIETETHPSYP